MHFDLVDAVIEREGAAGEVGSRIVTIKNVSAAEEYLQDHFPGFPVLPGVLMVESLVQAARRLLGEEGDGRLVLGGVRAVKYGRFVRPGEVLRVEVSVVKRLESGAFECKGEGRVIGPAAVSGAEEAVAVSGRFTMRPVRLGI